MAKTMTMKEMMKVMMDQQNQMMERFETLDKRVSALESGRTSSSPKRKASSTSTSTTTKAKSKTKTPASPKPKTKTEAVDKWCAENGFSEADRKAFGKACREVREALRQKAEKDGYMSKAQYRRAANKMMADKGFGPMFR